jgi:ribonuclease PH
MICVVTSGSMTDHGTTNLSLSTPEKIVRSYNRTPADLRPLSFQRDFTEFAAGSVLVSFGRTRVLVTASVDEDVPRWMKGTERGWVTAEYSMLPGSSPERVDREAAKGKQSGRTQEIQRLIGRSLRSVTDLRALGERQIILDCDVLQADGGTRTASICAAYVALHDACTRLVQNGSLPAVPLMTELAAISVGVVQGTPMLDLDYSEDSTAEVDMNIVMTGAGEFTELQGTAEGRTFGRATLNELIGLAENGINQIIAAQREVLAVPPTPRQLDPR